MKRTILTFIFIISTIVSTQAEESVSTNGDKESQHEATHAGVNQKEHHIATFQSIKNLYGYEPRYEKTLFRQRNQYRTPRGRYQEDYEETPRARRGYIGIGLGGAVALDSDYDYEDNVGGQFTVNFGYLFSRRVGIAASLIFSEYEYYYYGTSGFVAGPLFSFGTANGNFSFDLRPGIGYAEAVDSYNDDGGFIYDLGLSLRWGLGRYMSMSFNMDFYEGPGTPALGVSLGVNYRLK